MNLRLNAAQVSDLLLHRFIHPPGLSRRALWAFLLTLVLSIGIWDFDSGLAHPLSLFYLVPVSLSAAWFGARAGITVALLVTVVRIGCDGLSHLPAALPARMYSVYFAALAIFLFVVWLLHSLVSLHRQLESKIVAQSDELRATALERDRLELEILKISARERSAFGRELHDELGQHFVATALAAQTLAEKLGERDGAAEARAIVAWIEKGIGKTRNLARGLLLARIEPNRFAQELDELAIGVSGGAVRCCLIHKGGPINVDASKCAELYRIAQEAVGNALRHARARVIRIELTCDQRALCLSVADNGCGLPPPGETSRGLGLRIMKHRAKVIGASFAVVSRPGEGTRVKCELRQAEALGS